MKVPGVFYHAKTVRDVPAGTVIFEEGSTGTEMFGVVEGEVEVFLVQETPMFALQVMASMAERLRD